MNIKVTKCHHSKEKRVYFYRKRRSQRGMEEIVGIKQNAPLSKSTAQNCSFLNSMFCVFHVFFLKGELLWEYFAIFEKRRKNKYRSKQYCFNTRICFFLCFFLKGETLWEKFTIFEKSAKKIEKTQNFLGVK